jgi:hypothetical protein
MDYFLWLVSYRVEKCRQWLRSAAKRAIMAGINGAGALGECLIRTLGLEGD